MIERITKNNKEIILIGTAHISEDSVNEVREVIEKEKPDIVCVELCKQRYELLNDNERWKQTDIIKIIKENKIGLFVVSLILSNFQRRLGEDVGILPGAEMIEAIKISENLNIPIELSDRDINITMRRAFSKMGIIEKYKMFTLLLFTLLFSEKMSKDEIENLKNTDILSQMINEFAVYFPNVKSVLIDERDFYLTKKILDAKGKKIVAVVGAGHIQGIKKNIENFDSNEKKYSMEEILSVPKGRNLSKIFGYSFVIILIAIFVYGFYVKGIDTFLSMSTTWFLYHAIFAAIGAILALASPITILATFIAAPFTAIHPGIGIGMVSSLVEAKVRPPKVIDFENLHKIRKLKDLWKNQVFRIILIFFFTSTGGSIATFLSLGTILPMIW